MIIASYLRIPKQELFGDREVRTRVSRTREPGRHRHLLSHLIARNTFGNRPVAVMPAPAQAGGEPLVIRARPPSRSAQGPPGPSLVVTRSAAIGATSPLAPRFRLLTGADSLCPAILKRAPSVKSDRLVPALRSAQGNHKDHTEADHMDKPGRGELSVK